MTKLFKTKDSSQNSYYWQYFGLLCDPFASEIDLSKIFIPPAWEVNLDLLQHWLVSENVVVAVTGPKGIGTSTLAETFLNQLHEVATVASQKESTDLNLNYFIAFLIEKFQLESRAFDMVEEQLDDIISQLQYKEKACVVIFDKAEQLPDETLNALIYLLKQQAPHQMRFHAFLFGDIELQTKLAKVARDEMNRDFVKTLELEPFTLDESRRYILHRLTQAGLHEPVPLSEIAIERIYEMSQGNPEDINQRASEFMMDELDRQKTEVVPSLWQTYQTHFIGAGVIFAVLLLVGLVFLRSPAKQPPVAAQSAPSLNFAVNAAPSQAAITPSASQNPPAVNQNPPLSQQSAALPLNRTQNNPTNAIPISENPALPAKVASAASSMSSDNSSTQINPNHLEQNTSSSRAVIKIDAPKVEEEKQSALKNHTADHAIDHPVVVKTSESSVEKQMVSDKNIDQDVLSGKLEKTEKPEKLSDLRKSLHHQHKVKNEEKIKKSDHTQSKKMPESIGALSENRYTLQLIALSSETAVNQFVKSNRLEGKAKHIKRHLNGKTLYVVVYGSFHSPAEANAAKALLPQTIRSNAWLRKISAIKKET